MGLNRNTIRPLLKQCIAATADGTRCLMRATVDEPLCSLHLTILFEMQRKLGLIPKVRLELTQEMAWSMTCWNAGTFTAHDPKHPSTEKFQVYAVTEFPTASAEDDQFYIHATALYRAPAVLNTPHWAFRAHVRRSNENKPRRRKHGWRKVSRVR